MNSIERQVIKALYGLGSSSADIASTLANKGVQGTPRSVAKCVISVYILQQFPELDGFYTTMNGMGGDGWSIPTTVARAEFIDEFDDGFYPDLVSA